MKHILISFLVIVLFSVLPAQNLENKVSYTGQLDVLNHLKLSLDEEDVLYEILLLDEDIRFAEREIEFTSKRIEELKEICKLSSEFEDIRAKADRKYKRSVSFVNYLESDLEEYRSIEKKLLYQIYANQLTRKTRTHKFKKNSLVKMHKKEAERLSLMAEKTMKAFDSDLTELQLVDTLRKMNCLYAKAIDNQRAALAICLDVELFASKACEDIHESAFLAESGETFELEIMDNEEEFDEALNEGFIESPILIASTENTYEQLSSKGQDPEFSLLDISLLASEERMGVTNYQAKINQKIVYKVQVGAFYDEVDKNDFRGLNPISIDDNTDDFSKVMVGTYYSYRAAMKARAILIKTTDYDDAFVVVYEDNVRIPLSKAINQNNNTSDRQAYTSFKNTSK